MKKKQKTVSWWHSFPGILTATAGIITAVTGLIVALHQVGFFARDDNKPQNSTVLFQGTYIGEFTSDLYPNGISIRTYLKKQNGQRVIGRYMYGMKEGTIDGYIKKDILYFEWQESGVYGHGIFYPKEGGKKFFGKWGFKESQDNGGMWYGYRQ